MTAWLLWMVLACLSDGAVARCSVESTITASEFSRVSCPSLVPDSEQIKYLLLLNNSDVAQLQIKMKPKSAESLLSAHFDVTANEDGLYVCKMEVHYPPPYREDCHSIEVKVDDTEKQHVLAINSINSTTPPTTTTATCPDRSSFVPEVVLYAACSVLLVYSLLVTGITIITWRKMKENEEDTSVYMNTRPSEPRKNYRV